MNLASLSFLDSTGVGVLVGIWHRVCRPGAAWPWPRRPVRSRGILETTGLTKVLPIYDTEAAAVQACREPTAR